MITIHLVAPTKAEAKKRFGVELAKLVRAQPIHVKDALIIEACVNAYIDTLVQAPDFDIAVSVNNHLEGRINNQASDFITLANLNLTIQLMKKEAA